MAVCGACENDMLTAATCVEVPAKIDGESLSPIRYGSEGSDWLPQGERCHDCGVARGGFHHPGCDAERCPKCRSQIISCGCLDESIEEAEE